MGVYMRNGSRWPAWRGEVGGGGKGRGQGEGGGRGGGGLRH